MEQKLSFSTFRGKHFYNQVYAECEVFPALKSGGRYFRLQEVKTTPRCR